MACTIDIPAHVADVAIIVADIPQSLRKLAAANACQPILDVVVIGRLVRAAAYSFFVAIRRKCRLHSLSRVVQNLVDTEESIKFGYDKKS